MERYSKTQRQSFFFKLLNLTDYYQVDAAVPKRLLSVSDFPHGLKQEHCTGRAPFLDYSWGAQLGSIAMEHSCADTHVLMILPATHQGVWLGSWFRGVGGAGHKSNFKVPPRTTGS